MSIVGSDAFSRNVAQGWGAADVGGTWQTSTGDASIFRVDGAQGLIVLPSANPRVAVLSGVSVLDGVGQVAFSMERSPDSPSGAYTIQTYCRRSASNGNLYYRFRVRAFGSGRIDLRIEKNVNGVETWVSDNLLTSVVWRPAAMYWIRWECAGVSPATTVRMRVWAEGTTEPSTWHVSSVVDDAQLDYPGTTGFRVSGPTTSQVNFPLTVALDDFEYATPTKVNSAPISNPGGPYSGTVGSEIAFDGSASSDPDNDIPLTYQWDFGDGATGSGVAPTHSYAAAGTYTAVLTVTDSRGLSGKPSSTTVTIGSGDVGFLVRDRFSRTVADGWGSPEVGGRWRLSSGGPSLFRVDGSQGQITVRDAKPHNVVASEGYGVDVAGLVSFSTSVLPDLSGRSHTVQSYARRNDSVTDGDNYYRYRVRLFRDGKMDVRIEKNVNATPTWLADNTSIPVLWQAGAKYWMRWECFGVSPTTTVRMKVWKDGAPEPAAWQIERVVSEPGLDVGGTTGVRVAPPGDQTTFPIVHSFDDLEYRRKQ